MLGIVVVSYKTDELTISYLQNELSKIGLDNKIIIVNNSGDIMSSSHIAQRCSAHLILDRSDIDITKNVFVIGCADNLGYSRGNNLGAQILLQHFPIDHLLFSNNDIKIIDSNVIETLVDVMDMNDDVGVVGPRILGLDGRDQNPSRYMSVWTKYIIPWLLYPLVYPLVKRGYFKDVIHGASEGAYYRVSGCFMLVRATAYLEVDGFDSETFLYAEEEILSERMLLRGYKVYYCVKASIVHEHGAVTRQFLSARQGFSSSFESELYYYCSYIGISTLALLLAKLSKAVFLNLYLPIIKTVSFCSKAYRNI